MNKIKTKNDFEFISEKPLKASSDMKLSFGHKEIVTVLKSIVKKSPESFTIGLYGDWGSGKSTIAISLKEELKSEKIPLVIFDVWKHEGDSLRRTFLNLLVNDLQRDYDNEIFKNDFKLSDRINNSQVTNDEIQKLNFEKIKPHFFAILILSTGLLLPFFIFWFFFDFLTGWLLLSEAIGKIVISIFSIISFSVFFKYINQFIDVKKVTTSEDKFKDPHEFENEFRRILKEGLKTNKIVIVFDNLDRVNGDKTLEIMSTIKTFLDPIDKSISDKDITFIIPCDEKAIKRHLKKSLNYSDDDLEYERYSSEYLRKFFNSIIWIPEFYTNELEKLASKTLNDTKIDNLNNDDIAALIVLVFDKNPRQIIQYVNILTSNYLLIKERNIDGFDLKNDISQFAKYLLLVQTFPDFMDFLKNKSIYDLEELKNFPQEEKVAIKNYNEFINFLELTNHIKIDSLDVFFKLRKSEFEVEFGNTDKLLRLIQTQEINNVINFILSEQDKKLNLSKVNNDDIKYLKELNILEKNKVFNSIIKQSLSTINNQILIVKFIDGLISLMKFKDIQIDLNTYRTLNEKFKKGINSLYIINPDNFLTQIVDKINDNKLKNNFLELIKEKWIFYINSYYNNQDDTSYLSVEYHDNLWNVFIDKHIYFNSNDFKIVRQTISTNLVSNLSFIERISETEQLRKNLSSSDVLNNMLTTANIFGGEKIFNSEIQFNDELLKIVKVCEIICMYEVNFISKNVSESCYKFLIFNLKTINNLNQGIGNEDLLVNSLYNLFSKDYIIKRNVNDSVFLKELYDIIYVNFTEYEYKNSNWFFKYYYLFYVNEIDDSVKINILNEIVSFINTTNAEYLIDLITPLVSIKAFFITIEFEKVIYERSLNEFDFLEVFYSFFTDENKQNLLERWIITDSKIAYQFLEKMNFKIPNVLRFSSKILELTSNFDNFLENEIRYEIFFKIKEFDDLLRAKYSDQIIKLVTSHFVNYQILGIKEIRKNTSFINEFYLKEEIENVLGKTFFNSFETYKENIINIFSLDFGGKKKLLNDLWNRNEIFKNNLIQYIFSYDDLEIFNLFKGLLFKVNYVELVRMLILDFNNRNIAEISMFNKIEPFLNIIVNDRYKKEFYNELQMIVTNYTKNGGFESNDLIYKIKKILL